MIFWKWRNHNFSPVYPEFTEILLLKSFPLFAINSTSLAQVLTLLCARIVYDSPDYSRENEAIALWLIETEGVPYIS